MSDHFAKGAGGRAYGDGCSWKSRTVARSVLLGGFVGAGGFALTGNFPRSPLESRVTPPPVQQNACRRAAPRAWRAGEVVVVSTPTDPVCRLSFRSLPQALRVDDADAHGIGEWVVRDRRGRFYTYSGRGSFTVWNSDGTFRLSRGRDGAGPGEFRRGAIHIHPAPNGSVWVFDTFLKRWAVYDTSYRLLRTIPYAGKTGVEYSSFLDDGTFITGDLTGSDPATLEVVQLGDPARIDPPIVLRRFAPVTPGEASFSPAARDRLVAYAGGTSVWVGPPRATGRGYELQLWNSTGALLRTIRRNASWFPAGSDRESTQPGIPAPGEMGLLVSLGDGLVLVGVTVPNSSWASAVRSAREPARPGQLPAYLRGLDVHVEVIDTESASVLAHVGPMTVTAAADFLPAWFFQGSRIGYRRTESPAGDETIRLVELLLTAR